MKLDKLTVKAQEAIAASRDLAVSRNHAEVRPEHLLVSLIDQEGGVVPRILGKLGADPRVVRADVDRALGKLPRATGASLDVEALELRSGGHPRIVPAPGGLGRPRGPGAATVQGAARSGAGASTVASTVRERGSRKFLCPCGFASWASRPVKPEAGGSSPLAPAILPTPTSGPRRPELGCCGERLAGGDQVSLGLAHFPLLCAAPSSDRILAIASAKDAQTACSLGCGLT